MGNFVESGHQALVELQAELQLPLADDWSNAAFEQVWMKWLNDIQPQGLTQLPVEDPQRQQVCGAVPPEPGIQTSGVTVNGVALRLPHVILPSDNQSAVAPGCYPRKIVTEVSAGTNLMATSRSAVYFTESNKAQGKIRKRRTPSDEVHECKPCKKTFNCKKDLRRHLRSTKAHNASPVAVCTCGKMVTRMDAMRSHRSYCRGTTLQPETAQAAGLMMGN
jgi:hypothetical protein